MENLEFNKNLKKAITAQKRTEQKEFLKSVEKTVSKPKKTNWLIAASVAVIIGFGSYFFLQPATSDELYNTYYSRYENVVAPVVRDQIKLSKKNEVFAFYEQENYKKAIDGFNQLSEKDFISTATINFYKANSYLQLREYIKAQELFTLIIKSDVDEWKKESLWYLSLTSIKLNAKNIAINDLKRLQKENNNYKRKEVEELLKKLNATFY